MLLLPFCCRDHQGFDLPGKDEPDIICAGTAKKKKKKKQKKQRKKKQKKQKGKDAIAGSGVSCRGLKDGAFLPPSFLLGLWKNGYGDAC
jgi:hypothetical protein